MLSKRLALSGLVIALYIAILYMTQGFSFLQFQVRVANSLYGLAYIHPFLVIPLGLAVFKGINYLKYLDKQIKIFM